MSDRLNELRERGERETEARNRREGWVAVARYLKVAAEELVHAQEALEDLHEEANADKLQPLVDDIRRAIVDADEQATKR